MALLINTVLNHILRLIIIMSLNDSMCTDCRSVISQLINHVLKMPF